MAVVSTDHADESMCAEDLASPFTQAQSNSPRPRPISLEEVEKHNGMSGGTFWCVIDGYVVDATEFLDSHPGGRKKILSTDKPDVGATGRPFGFSFSRGRNAHFPQTGKRFRNGVEQYLNGGGGSATTTGEPFLPPFDVAFPEYGKIVILGRLP